MVVHIMHITALQQKYFFLGQIFEHGKDLVWPDPCIPANANVLLRVLGKIL